MKVTRVTGIPYCVGYKQDWSPAMIDFPVFGRSGFLVVLRTSDGLIGLGEIAPLMRRWGTETTEEAQRGLKRLTERQAWPSLPKSVMELDAWMAECELDPRETPALVFGVQCALAHLISIQRDKPLHLLLNEAAADSIRANALIAGSDHKSENIRADVARAVDRGYDAVKIKVGRWMVWSDCSMLIDVRRDYPNISIRTDANSSWELPQAKSFCRMCAEFNLEYVEDPLKEPTTRRLRILARPGWVPVALDESVRSFEKIRHVISKRLCAVIVIKPTRLGSLREIAKIAQRARAAGIRVVITSMMESSIGLSYVVACAAAFGDSELAHGLSTAELLAEDTLTEPLFPVNGYMMVPEVRDLPGRLLPRYQHELGIPT